MTIDIKKLIVSTDEQRKGWIELLDKASQYHFDMAERFKPSLLTLDGEPSESDSDIFRIHTAWGNAISDAISLIDMWQVDEDVDNSVTEQRGMSKERDD